METWISDIPQCSSTVTKVGSDAFKEEDFPLLLLNLCHSIGRTSISKKESQVFRVQSWGRRILAHQMLLTLFFFFPFFFVFSYSLMASGFFRNIYGPSQRKNSFLSRPQFPEGFNPISYKFSLKPFTIFKHVGLDTEKQLTHRKEPTGTAFLASNPKNSEARPTEQQSIAVFVRILIAVYRFLPDKGHKEMVRLEISSLVKVLQAQRANWSVNRIIGYLTGKQLLSFMIYMKSCIYVDNVFESMQL